MSDSRRAALGNAVPGDAAPQGGIDPLQNSRSTHPTPNAPSQPKPDSGNRGWYSRGYLPHFDSPHVIQHITYRLADSLPHAVLQQMQAEIRALPLEEEQRRAQLRRLIDTYLDAGHGSSVLRDPDIAACLVDTWHRFDGERYRLLEWVVMPNHCHVLIEPFEGVPLGKIVLSWKNYTARFINVQKNRTGVRRTQSQPQMQPQTQSCVWQREYWDRFIRDQRHFEAVRDYILKNPVKAGLAAKPEDWPWSSAKDRAADSRTRGE
ncbi:MAG: transposase [Candidatus Latescibacterota bacterium]